MEDRGQDGLGRRDRRQIDERGSIGEFRSASLATCCARRVLPTPPGPVRVSSRTSGRSKSSRTTSASCSRPTNEVRSPGGGGKRSSPTGAVRRGPRSSGRCRHRRRRPRPGPAQPPPASPDRRHRARGRRPGGAACPGGAAAARHAPARRPRCWSARPARPTLPGRVRPRPATSTSTAAPKRLVSLPIARATATIFCPRGVRKESSAQCACSAIHGELLGKRWWIVAGPAPGTSTD